MKIIFKTKIIFSKRKLFSKKIPKWISFLFSKKNFFRTYPRPLLNKIFLKIYSSTIVHFVFSK